MNSHAYTDTAENRSSSPQKIDKQLRSIKRVTSQGKMANNVYNSGRQMSNLRTRNKSDYLAVLKTATVPSQASKTM